MAECRPQNYPKLKDYKPSRFMLPTCHYDAAKADRAVTFIENLRHTKGKWAGKRFWLLPWQEQIIRDIFAGKQGPCRDIVCMNAGAALMLAGTCATIADGVRKAEIIIDSGLAARKLDEIMTTSQELGTKASQNGSVGA